MPSDDYTSAVRGGLKLKGASSAKPSGIKKKKKKTAASTSDSKAESIEKALVDEDAKQKNDGEGERDPDELSEEQLKELEQRGGDGKTASERAYEDMRRKRVRSNSTTHSYFSSSQNLQDGYAFRISDVVD